MASGVAKKKKKSKVRPWRKKREQGKTNNKENKVPEENKNC